MKTIDINDIVNAIQEVMEMSKYNSETAKIREEVLPYCTGKGLDIGCGNDKIHHSAVGIDNRPLPTVDMAYDLERRLPFPDAEFDYVYSSHTLEHMIGWRSSLNDWIRVLKAGSHLILYLPHPDHYVYDEKFPEKKNPEHKHHDLYPELVVGYLIDRGFEILVFENDIGEDRYSFLIVGRKNV